MSSFPPPDAFPPRDETIVNFDPSTTDATVENVDLVQPEAVGDKGVVGRLRNSWIFVKTNFTVSELSGSLGELRNVLIRNT